MDTVRLTLQGLKPDVIRQGVGEREWRITSERGKPVNYKVIIPLNEDGGKHNGTVGVTYDPEKMYLNVHVSSIPTMVHGTSLERIRWEQVPGMIDTLNSIVEPYIHTHINGFMVTRYDNSTLYKVIETPPEYIICLDAITRTKQLRYHKSYYQGQYLQFRNNTRTVGFYDKIGKAVMNEIEREKLYKDGEIKRLPDLLRYEIQNKTGKAVKAINGRPLCFDDLKSEQVAQAFINQRKKMFDQLFIFNAHTKTLLSTMDTWQHIQQINPRSATGDTATKIALEQGWMTPELIRGLMEAAGGSRQGINKAAKKLNSLIGMNIPKRELYQELKTAIHNDNEI